MPYGQVLGTLMGVWQACDIQSLVLFEGFVADRLHQEAHFQCVPTERRELQPGIQRGTLVTMEEESELPEPSTVVFVDEVAENSLETLGHSAAPVDIFPPHVFQLLVEFPSEKIRFAFWGINLAPFLDF